jgi:predicted ATPase
MAPGKITELRVRGLRTLADVTLSLEGLLVLIGENGSGKTSLIEACELLRLTTDYTFFDRLQKLHGGLPTLLRVGSRELTLGVTCQKTGSTAAYKYDIKLALEPNSSYGVAISERLQVHHKDGTRTLVFERHGRRADVHSLMQPERTKIDSMDERLPLLASWGRSFGEQWAVDVVEIMSSIDVQIPFDSPPRWTLPEAQSMGARGSNIIQPTQGIERRAVNLANAFFTLRNRRDWPETLEYVRLGLGPHILDVTTQPDPAGGLIALLVEDDRYASKIPASAIADGTLAYLAFVALFRLNTDRALLCFDEPETHLHPELLLRVISMFESLGQKTTVLISTHSDRLLDGLTQPQNSVVLCELDEEGSTQLIRPNAEALTSWLTQYQFKGLGDIRAEGHIHSVMPPSNVTRHSR